MTSKSSTGPITDLTGFITKTMEYAERETRFKCYRGQRDSSWRNVPGLFRPDLVNLEACEKRAVRDLISVHPHEFRDDETMFDRLVRMQHFGLPTRLMDVSRNPLVALYFATDPGPAGETSDGVVTAFAVPEEREKYFDSDSVSCMANLANMTKDEKAEIIALGHATGTGDKAAKVEAMNRKKVYQRLYQFIRVEKSHFLPDIDPMDLFKPYYVHPKMSNRRILAQAGGFIIHGVQSGEPINYRQPIVETRFVIPAGAKADLRKALDLLGITESTLFPEIDKAARRIETSYSRP